MTTGESQGNIVKLSDIRREKHRASSPYGPVRAGLITWQNREIMREDQEVQLTELLSSLESAVATLISKSYTVSDTLIIATQGVRVALYGTTIDEGGTDV
jgi:hypothetical protein